MNRFYSTDLNGYLAGLVISVGALAVQKAISSEKKRKAKKALEKELNNLKREAEKGIVDVDNYVIYPA